MVGGQGYAGWAGGGVVARLDAEWAGWADDPAAAQACRRWARSTGALRGAGSLDEVLERVREAPDEVLGALLAAARGGDALAARVVAQSMLGKVVTMAARDPHAEVDDYVAVLWCTVATYPLAARPVRIAANLALDTLKAVHRERRPAGDSTATPEEVMTAAERRPAGLVGFGRATPPGPSAARVIAAAQDRRLVDPPTGALLHSVYADGLPGSAAARRHHTSPAAVRVRCSRALRRLADHAVLLAEAG